MAYLWRTLTCSIQPLKDLQCCFAKPQLKAIFEKKTVKENPHTHTHTNPSVLAELQNVPQCMSKHSDISMHPIFLQATSMMIRNLSVLCCAARGASSETWVCLPWSGAWGWSWGVTSLHRCHLLSLGKELTSTGHGGTKRVSAPPQLYKLLSQVKVSLREVSKKISLGAIRPSAVQR